MSSKNLTKNLLDILIEDDSISKSDIEKIIEKINKVKVNIILVGGTGSGKSSTINALFDMQKAKVGEGANPETKDVKKYELDNLVLWDTPGLGDSPEADAKHEKTITEHLLMKNDDGSALIDLVLLIVDGSHRDMASTFKLLENVILPSLNNDTDRLLVAINQADLAMKGRGWNHNENIPNPELVNFLEEKVESIKERIKQSKGLSIDPIYYAAGLTDGDYRQPPYNLGKLLNLITKSITEKKRFVFFRDINKDKTNFETNDGKKDYNHDTSTSITTSFVDFLKDSLYLVGQVTVGVVVQALQSKEVLNKATNLIISIFRK